MAKKQTGPKKSKKTSPCPPLPYPNNAADALKLLRSGNRRFVRSNELTRCNKARRKQFHIGQEPWCVVLACADSRLSPELIFDVGIGELFVVRVAGNIANACSIASIEYAVAPKELGGLGIDLVVVLGHENCGAIKASLKQHAISYNLNQLLGHLLPVADQYADRWATASKSKKPAIELKAARSNARSVAKQLRVQSEIMISNKSVSIVPAVYKTGSGKVKFAPECYWPKPTRSVEDVVD